APGGGAATAASPAATPPAGGGGQIAEVTVEGYDIGWTQPEVTVTPGTTVQLVNTGAAGHNFEVTDLGINVDMPAGETVTATIPADAAPGTYEFICNIPGHAEAGMVGTLIVQVAGAAAAAAPGGQAAPPADPAPPGGGAQVAEVTVEGFDIGWTPTEITVSPGTTVRLPNVGAAGHNFEVAELGINVDMPVGETVTATIPADAAPGTYEFICNVPGHAPAGMVGTLTVQ
ncbi:MAG: plastocyanin/azurin family copper-binding protein, partial [Chloroflexota bacterium]|nr:plastocyanin/azurin family copper-binding protein [Chloroflexota bacterium]